MRPLLPMPNSEEAFFKLRDYAATRSAQFCALISQDEMRGLVYVRDPDGRLDVQNATLLEGPEAVIEIVDLGICLRFVDLYEGVELS